MTVGNVSLNSQDKTPAISSEVNQIEVKAAVDAIVAEVQVRLAQPGLEKETGITPQGVAGWVVKLIKKLGKGYVTNTLPRVIYSKFPSQVAGKITEEAWVGVWNTYILMGPLDELHDIVTKKLEPYMWHWLASTCGYIVQGAVWLLI